MTLQTAVPSPTLPGRISSFAPAAPAPSQLARAPLLAVTVAAFAGVSCAHVTHHLPPTTMESTGVPDLQGRLRGNAVVMLGEVHDNGRQHQLRLEWLQRAFAAGWRPALVMEQFDREHQPDIERARQERPRDAQHVIDLAAPHTEGSAGGGWDWNFYRPFVALALEYDVPLVAANLSREDAARVVRGGYATVFDPQTLRALGLERSVDPAWEAAQEHEIDVGHCHALPPSLLPAMAHAQFARDAVMADILRQQTSGGVVLLAGNGHVRRDLGVPRWLGPALQARLFTVGFLEQGETAPAGSFDAVVYAPPAARPAPCRQFEKPRAGG